jgi:hypothetical protein
MWTPKDIAEAIAEHRPQAVEALAAVQLNSHETILNADGLDGIAKALGRDVGDFWVEQLQARSLLVSFATALHTQGVAIDMEEEDPPTIATTAIKFEKLEPFLPQARKFRCRILRNNQVVGSGALIGPTSVLTAWHVIACAAPDRPQEPAPTIDVLLADGERVRAAVPARWQSLCSPGEFAGRMPANDDEIADAHDVAVLKLVRPAGALLGRAPFPEEPGRYRPNASLLLIHYPEGEDQGIGLGTVTKIRRISGRWAHSIGSRGGSSGGAFFDTTLTLAGIHQGKDEMQQGRLVPTALFYKQVREIIAQDEAPARMWSLDGTPLGEYVIGRQRFFEAFAAARREGRVRGIRIRRSNAAGNLTGIPFSFDMLAHMVARTPETRHLRISFEAVVPDLADEIVRRADAAGLTVARAFPAAGVAEGQSAPEAVGADRGRRVAAELDRRAGALGIQLWVFIDHPAISFGDDPRAILDGFIDQALRLPRLRLVVAGYEAVTLPGVEFDEQPAGDGPAGLITDIIAGFAEGDVRLFLHDAAEAAGKTLSPERTDELVELALKDLDNVTGIYEPWLAKEVSDRLRPEIVKLF